MFPPNSTSENILTPPDAAVLQNVTRTEDFPSTDIALFPRSNEVLSAAAQTNSMFYSDQMPVCTDSCGEYPIPVLAATVDILSKAQISNEYEFSSENFKKIKFDCDSKDLFKFPQNILNVSSNFTDNDDMPIVVEESEDCHMHGGEEKCDVRPVGSDLCDHSFSCSKSEALCHVSLGNDSGRARADPTSLSISKTSFSMSVISSSTCGTTDSPSGVTDCGAEEFASHLCSSSNNSLLTYAQNISVDFNNLKTNNELICIRQTLQYPNMRSQIMENDSVELLCSACRNTDTCKETGLPSAIVLLEENNILIDMCKNGALNLYKVPSFKTYDMRDCNVPHLSNSDAGKVRHSVLSEGISNIPVSQKLKCDTFSFAHIRINATIQGNTKRDPPDSFNNINNKISNITKSISCNKYFTARDNCAYSVFEGPASNARWGIPRGLGLRGGGESTLTSGTSSWSTPPGTSTNNNNNGNTSGWGANNSGQGNTPPQNQWGNSSSTGNSNNNNNVNRSSTGSGNSNTQPSNGQQSSGNSAKNNGSQGNQSQAQQPPSSQSSQQQSAQSQNGSTSWAQAAGKGLVTNPSSSNPTNNNGNNTSTVLGANNNNSANSNGSSNSSNASSNSGSSSTKQQLEQLNCMREALFSQDGWGGQHVNQDTGWDIPASPEPGAKDGVPVWKPNVNNGTDLWEANLRNGGQPPPSQTQKTPWGHTPTTNIGGTWGEDDDGDSSNVWTGVPANVGPGTGSSQWGGTSAGPSGGNGGMWGGPKKDNEWVGGSSNSGPNWGDPRDPRAAIDPRNVNALDPRDVRGSAGDPRDPRSSTIIDPREHMRNVVDTIRDPRDIRGMGDMRSAESMMRGDPRGITGRLNGNDGAMWGQPPHHHHGTHHQQNQPPAMNQWSGPPPKDINLSGSGSKPSGWEEPSPPAQRRNIPNYDDGTSLWGNPGQTQNRMGGKVSHWKEMPQPRAGLQCPPGMPPSRLPGNGSGSLKGDNPLWPHPSRNGSWGDTPHETGNTGWGDENKVVNVSSWNEAPLNASSPWGSGSKPKNPPGWADEEQPWAHKQGPKPLSKDLVWASKQFRILAEMGYKKEDVESALRTCNMNLEDALELLNTGRMNMEWRRHEEHSPFEITSNHPGSGFSGQRYNPVGQQMSFAPPGGPGVNNTPSLMNNLNNTNPSLASINSISPAIVQKILTQQPPPQQSHQQTPFNQSSRTPQNQPSTAQLRMLVQQIQMAVQAGYLNHQILNQPLAPQTLILLNQLLQQIKVLQQLMQQQTLQVPSLKGSSNTVLHMSVQITKTKQQINNLQNQIASQQAIYVKQQQQQHHHMASQPPQSADFKPNFHDPLSTLQSSFGDMSLKESQAFQTQQSRLIQWKLPALDKDSDNGGNEFSRAPGSTSVKPNLQQSHSSPNINPLLSQGESTWSTISRSNSDTGWPDSGGDAASQSDVKDTWPVTTQPGSSAFTDLVPEFEPGKPWKGTQMKSIEDDPSITPGSVVRSPLSLATIKDTEIFSSGNKTSPTVSSSVDTPVPPLSLSSSTWSFNPSASTSTSFTSPLGKLGAKSTWGDAPPPTAVTSELWGAPVNKSRPPPGLTSKGLSNVSSGSTSGGNGNGWSLGGRTSSWGVQTWGSTWLLLKNLTPQIDGSTLKTLCVQHGPVQNFHLYLNHGIALAKYSTREEANKAQGALNNCVLGNTTIFAESPADSEVLQLLQHLGHSTQQAQSNSSISSWSARGTSAPSIASTISKTTSSDTWAPGGSQLWSSNPSSNSLWGSAPLDSSGDQHRATPSSLNSFLPGDLLGGESM